MHEGEIWLVDYWLAGEIAELLYALSGWVARMESQRRSERTKAGLARAIAKGKKLGRIRVQRIEGNARDGGFFSQIEKKKITVVGR